MKSKMLKQVRFYLILAFILSVCSNLHAAPNRADLAKIYIPKFEKILKENIVQFWYSKGEPAVIACQRKCSRPYRDVGAITTTTTLEPYWGGRLGQGRATRRAVLVDGAPFDNCIRGGCFFEDCFAMRAHVLYDCA